MIEAGFTDQTIAVLYGLSFKLTKNIMLSMFQFKIIHHILYTREQLFKAKITDSDILSCVWIEADPRASVRRMPACPLLLKPFYLSVER